MDAIRELLRVARRAVILVEPIYELAGPEARTRMREHGYVRGLKATVERLGAIVSDYRLLGHISNPLNPSGVIVIDKGGEQKNAVPRWRCPLTHVSMKDKGDAFVAEETGLIYPVLRGIPLFEGGARSHRIQNAGRPIAVVNFPGATKRIADRPKKSPPRPS
jgi:hypothetical protein